MFLIFVMLLFCVWLFLIEKRDEDISKKFKSARFLGSCYSKKNLLSYTFSVEIVDNVYTYIKWHLVPYKTISLYCYKHVAPSHFSIFLLIDDLDVVYLKEVLQKLFKHLIIYPVENDLFIRLDQININVKLKTDIDYPKRIINHLCKSFNVVLRYEVCIFSPDKNIDDTIRIFKIFQEKYFTILDTSLNTPLFFESYTIEKQIRLRNRLFTKVIS